MPISLSRYESMDPYILVSAVNMQLRDDYSSLTDLCKAHEIDEAKLCAKLKRAGFEYDSSQKQFK